MGSRLGTACAAFALLSCTACGGQADAAPETGRKVSATRTSHPEPPSPYRDATGAMRKVALKFAEGVFEYESGRENRSDFQQRVAHLTTSKERTALLTSPRAQLPWRVLRARHERVQITISGVSVDTTRVSPTLVVAATRTTRTDFGGVTDFVELRVELHPSSTGWKVDNASGPGL